MHTSDKRDRYNPFPGLYAIVFLNLEPLSTLIPVFATVFISGGASWFYNEQVPGNSFHPLEGRPHVKMMLGQLVNAYAVIGMLSAFGFRAVRSSLPHDAVAQDRIIGAFMSVLAIADLTHIMATVAALPWDIVINPAGWNGTVNGNITGSMILFILRVSWFMGIGRQPASFKVE